MYKQIKLGNKRLFGIGKRSDGGNKSGVTAYIIESKFLFSLALLHFKNGTREAYHSHAFNALTLWLKGKVREHMIDGTVKDWKAGKIKYTSKNTFHKVESLGDSWALSMRGPWENIWKELRDNKLVYLTHDRKVFLGVK